MGVPFLEALAQKEMKMSREDLLWVGIRAFGIYLLVLAVLAVPGLISGVLMATQFAELGATDRGSGEAEMSWDKMIWTLQKSQLGAAVDSGLRLVLFALAGLYLLRGGRLVFRLASRPL